MRVAIVGGKLQGIEASYLAKKAGWEVILIDKNESAPALGLCDKLININIISCSDIQNILDRVDLIVPALEDQRTLTIIESCAKKASIPIMFDSNAYNISSSKKISNDLFSKLQLPVPLPWPKCGLPIIMKPSFSSGSRGVVKVERFENFPNAMSHLEFREDWIVEQFLEGPSYSIEVIGFKGIYKVLQITEILVDEGYDCNRVLAPALLSSHLKTQFNEIALALAKEINLNGIMDVETILYEGQLKVLEIDARLPSQTPTAVYKSCGINMLEIAGTALLGRDNLWANFNINESNAVIFEHIKVAFGNIEVLGEHIMTEFGPLYIYENFFGADEAITNYAPGKQEWVATLIITAKTNDEVWEKRRNVINQISEEIRDEKAII